MKNGNIRKLILAGICILTLLTGVCIIAVRNNPERKLQTLLELGIRYLENMEYKEAILAYEEAIEIDPSCAEAYIGMGEAYMALEQYSKAMEIIRYTQEIMPYFQTVSAYRLYSELEACVQALEKGYENTESLETGIEDASGSYEGWKDSIKEEIQYCLQRYEGMVYFPEEDIEEDDDISVEFVAEDDENLKGYKYIIYAHNIEGMTQALINFRSNVVIILDGIEYNMDKLLEADFSKLENIMIQGVDGTSLLCKSADSTVASIWKCKGLKLVNLIIGHDDSDFYEAEGCSAGVLRILNSDVSIYECDIFGCGVYGIYTENSDIICENTTIRDCSERIMELCNSNAMFQNCLFSGNNYKGGMPDAISAYTSPDNVEGDVEISFYDCIFRNNKNITLYDNTTYEDRAKIIYTFNNCTFSGNAWE